MAFAGADVSPEKLTGITYQGKEVILSTRQNRQNLAKAKWRKNNQEKQKQLVNSWKDKNKESVNQYARNYYHAHVEEQLLRNAARRTKIKQVKPNWANEFFISEIYRLARLRTKLLKTLWVVDHIVPLKGRTVSGLHSDGNLQVIPAELNNKKNNIYWPDKP